MTLESGFIINRRGRRLFYSTMGSPTAKRTWIFCNPFIEEKIFTVDIYKSFAKKLAANGDRVIRFDYEGDGDSEGEFETVNLTDWVQDVEAVYAFSQKHFPTERVCLFGFRLGANVSVLAAPLIRAERVLAWDPISDGDAYLQDCLRYNLMTQLATYRKILEDRKCLEERLKNGETVNILGFEVTQAMADSVRACNFVTDSGKSLLQHSFKLDAITFSDRQLQLLSQQTHGCYRAVAIEPFWNEPKTYDAEQTELFAASLEMIGAGT